MARRILDLDILASASAFRPRGKGPSPIFGSIQLEPFEGTENDDYIFAGAFAASENNAINGNGGDDFALGDIGSIFAIPDGATGNVSAATAENLDGGVGWSVSENPLVGDSSIPHAIIYVGATPDEEE